MIRQPYPVAIALRYLRARRHGAFISFISAVSMLGVALAVGVLIIVMAVVNGFESELERRILSVTPDAWLLGYAAGAVAPVADWSALAAAARERADIRATAPLVEGQGLVPAGDRLLAVTVRGIDPAQEPGVSSIGERLVAGTLEGLDADWNIVIGRRLADDLGIGLGDTLRLYTTRVNVTAAGADPDNRVFTVTGIFEVGMADFDRGQVLIGLDRSMTLFRTRNRANGLSLRVDDRFEAREIARDFANEAADRFGSTFAYEDWSRRHSNIFASIELTKPLLFIVLSLVVAIAAFNIVSTLFMVVREKRGDIAILRTLGSSPRAILAVFVTQGSCIGLIGVLGGLVLGLALVASLGTIVGWIEAAFAIDLLDADVYLIGELPTETRAGEIAGILALAFGLAVLATLYPAWRAARQPPAEALRND